MPQLFSNKEKKILYGLSITLALRQLGMLLVLPFLAVYGHSLAHSSSMLVGISLGIFGLSQALLQIPFGILSDKLGRKKPLLLALFLFLIGLILGYLATNIYLLIAARTFQGCGALAVIVFSWIGDSIDEGRRNRAMAVPGIFIGISSVISFVGGPLLYRIIDVPQMFLLCAILSGLALIFVLLFLEDQPPKKSSGFSLASFSTALRNTNLLLYYLGGLSVNICMVSVFFIVPMILNTMGRIEDSWIVFGLPTIMAIFVMRKATSLSDSGKTNQILALAFFAIFVSALLLMGNRFYLLVLSMIFFLSGYMSLATVLPATVTKLAPDRIRGSVTGVLNTMQFFGSFLGGTLAGVLWDFHTFLPILIIMLCGLGSGFTFAFYPNPQSRR